MAAAAPELRLASGALEIVCGGRSQSGLRNVAAVCDGVAGVAWRAVGEGTFAVRVGDLDVQLQARRRRRYLELKLEASTGSAVEARAIGLRFEPEVPSVSPPRLVYDGYQSWDAAGVTEAARATSWWRGAVADSDGAGFAFAAAEATRHCTRFDRDGVALSWLQTSPPLGEAEQTVWSSRGGQARFESHLLRIAAGDDVRLAMAAILPKLARPAARPAPRGWLSWYHLGIFVDAAAMLENSRLLADRFGTRLAPAVVQIDDGWQVAYGDWQPNTKFPDLSGLCRELETRGQVPGIWTAPFLASAASDLAAQAPASWFLQDPVTGARLIDSRHTVFGPMYVLDARLPEVRRHLARLFGELRGHGFRHFKIDFLYAGAYAGIDALRQGIRAIRRGAGADAYLLACGAPLLPVAGLADGCRIGPDTCTPWPDFTRGESQPMFFGEEVKNVIGAVAARSDLEPWFQLDPDVAVAGGAQSQASARRLLTTVAMSGGLYFLSDDLRTLSPERLALLTNADLADLAAGEPVQPEWPVDLGEPPAVWTRPDAVAVFNHSSAALTRAVAVPPDARLRDVWTGERLTSEDGTLHVTVEPGDVRLVRFDGS